MSIDLADEEYIASLQREVIPLGSSVFSDIGDDQWLGFLTDAFWEARLDGFLEGYVADEDGVIDPEVEGGADMSRKYVALIVLYAGVRILRNRLANTNTSFRAKAGPVEFEQQSGATVLQEMLKQLKSSKDRVLAELDEAKYEPTGTMVLDAFSVRLFDTRSYWGSPELTG